MFDYSKLRGRIRELYGTQGEFAKAVGRSLTHISQVLNGKSFLGQDELYKWADALGISDEEIVAYFFARKVHET